MCLIFSLSQLLNFHLFPTICILYTFITIVTDIFCSILNFKSKNTYQNNSAPSLEVGKLTEELEKTKKEQEKSESKPNTCNHVCPRFCEGTCPHGISGKKAAEGKDKCELFHPKRCIRYMRHFTHETRGCKEGDNCAYLHVNLCTSSVETKKCKDVNCKLMHLAGTKRPKSMLKKKTVNLPGETVKTPSDQAPEKTLPSQSL